MGRGLLICLSILCLAAFHAPRAVADDAVWDDTQQKELDQAREDLRQANLPDSAPAAGRAGEVLERDHLLADLVDQLEQSKDIRRRLDDSGRHLAEQGKETAAWHGFETPPPYSILMVDRIRQSLDDARSQAETARLRANLLAGEANANQNRLAAAEVALRQASERLMQSTGAEDKGRQEWLAQLARLDARDAAATLAGDRLRIHLSQDEASIQDALAELYRKQLEVASRNSVFTRSDLDVVLLGMEAEQRLVTERLKNAEAEIRKSRSDLADAQRRMAEAQAAPVVKSGADQDQMAVLGQIVDLRRLQADNADLRHEGLQHIQEVLEWKRTGWKLRWEIVNSKDGVRLSAAMDGLDGLIARVRNWNTIIQSEYLRSRRIRDEGEQDRASAMSKERRDLSKDFQAAYEDNSRILSDTEQAVGDLLALLQLWREDFQSKQRALSPREMLDNLWPLIRHGFDSVWNFELLAAEDTLVVDGRKVTAVRSVTVGKSIGLLLLVVSGGVLGHYFIRGGRLLAVGRFGASRSYARTVARWTELCFISLLLFFALYVTNIPLTVFAFLGGAIAIGAGFGAQVLIKNMICGILLLLERPIRVGDIIEAGDVVGTVTQINIRSSTIRTNDGIEVLVPNSSLLENNVTNWTYSTAKVRKTVNVGVAYDTDFVLTSDLLLQVAASHGAISQEPRPQVLLADFGSESVLFTIRYWIDYAEQTDASAIASDLRFSITRVLGENGIRIPHP